MHFSVMCDVTCDMSSYKNPNDGPLVLTE